MAVEVALTGEKKPLLYAIPAPRPRGVPSPTKKKSAIAIVGMLSILHLVWHLPCWIFPYSKHCGTPTFSYPGEKISWHHCGELVNRTLECGTLSVPMDHFNATNSGDKVFSLSLLRIRGRNATQNILFNPGGPGGSGVGALYKNGEKLHSIIGEGFHLLSFDPRGINGSLPAAACYPAGEEGQKSRRLHPLVHGGAKEADLAEIIAWTSNYVKTCEETMGEHGRYINTPQTAADMNKILDAIGQDDMLYYGVSYGTVLGQTYAAMFPERSKRVIIDGVVNVFQWYGDLMFSDSLVDNEKVFDSFLAECVKAGPENCTLAALAASESELKSKFLDFIKDLRTEPLSVYVNSTHHGIVTAETVLHSAIFNVLYRPSSWPDLADKLSQLMNGNATEFLLTYGLEDDVPDVAAFDFVMDNDGLSGPSHWPQTRDDLLPVMRQFWNSSQFSGAHSRLYYPKQKWSIPKTHNFTLKRPGIDGTAIIKTAHPLLILSTTYDPVTPLVCAKVANSAFEDSKIVEVKGYGHCSLAEPSRCMVQFFRDYLYEGKLPDEYTTCEVDLPYFPHIDGRDKVNMRTDHTLSEEEKAFEAQAALAGHKSWPL
jgi:pimeloyl-ACP methyl ester carboxylesterase